LSGLLIRRKHKEFNKLRRRIDKLPKGGLPAERIGGDLQIIHIRFDKGAEIFMAAIMRIKHTPPGQ
jgi:serine/threonine protein kinase HipA of HipAB toxin-antitoxin module